MARLNTYVPVQDSSGKSHLFGPDDKIPAWAEKAISNPHVWAKDEAPTTQAAPAAPAATAAPTNPATPAAADVTPPAATTEAAPAATTEAPATTTEAPAAEATKLAIPPKNGAGSGGSAWREYATKAAAAAGKQIEIPEDASRGDIIGALEAAGIPTEE